MEIVSSALCSPVSYEGALLVSPDSLEFAGMSGTFRGLRDQLPQGDQVFWGIPFAIRGFLAATAPCRLTVTSSTKGSPYLVFLHTTDCKPPQDNGEGFLSPMRGNPVLGEEVGQYRLRSKSGRECVRSIRRRYETGVILHGWGDEPFLCLPHKKAEVLESAGEAFDGKRPSDATWGWTQFRVRAAGETNARLYLYAMENPFPEEDLAEVELLPQAGDVMVLAGISACQAAENPLRWERRKKLRIKAPQGVNLFQKAGQLQTILPEVTLDLGTIISAMPVMDYDNENWQQRYNNQLPVWKQDEAILEYTAHPEACLCFADGTRVPLKQMEQDTSWHCCQVAEPHHDVKIRVVDAADGHPVPVKFHAHGEAGEYLAPKDRHRIPNPYWFEDYSPDFVHMGADSRHYCTYIPGETVVSLPLGRVYIEVSKGYEIRPVHQCFSVTPDTEEITIPLEKVLPWREKGWVTADTHVHFLSPQTALLEGEAEGVNVVNLLASQWGELFTNVGDFDGSSTINGSDPSYMVRVGTENRQHLLGHISLLGYEGSMILPLASGGPDESALGDGLETGLLGWAEQARKQNGLVVIPHLPNPRGENAAVIATGQADGVEMTSWGDLYGGISPYALSDWYRFLNCGYQVPAVGGTDKMSASTAVGTVRTYSYLKDKLFTYESWKESVRQGNTFVTYGPLLEFSVDGVGCGGTVQLPASGGTLDVEWTVASCTVPVTRVELVVNGEVREDCAVSGPEAKGFFRLPVQGSGWAALRVRGGYPDKSQVILAHSSSVMIQVEHKPCFSAPDAMTILEQMEAATAYVTHCATKAEERKYQAILLQLTAAHRALHNKMHQNGIYHHHTAVDDHKEHHEHS